MRNPQEKTWFLPPALPPSLLKNHQKTRGKRRIKREESPGKTTVFGLPWPPSFFHLSKSTIKHEENAQGVLSASLPSLQKPLKNTWKMSIGIPLASPPSLYPSLPPAPFKNHYKTRGKCAGGPLGLPPSPPSKTIEKHVENEHRVLTPLTPSLPPCGPLWDCLCEICEKRLFLKLKSTSTPRIYL